MATMRATAAVQEAVEERLVPALRAIEGNVREARLAMAERRHAAETLIRETADGVRRHPLRALACAGAGGALAGGMMGFACGWFARRRAWSRGGEFSGTCAD
jgi:ElaB/YqjD/DUF883 family membrane-anchored ribosome-binding protein